MKDKVLSPCIMVSEISEKIYIDNFPRLVDISNPYDGIESIWQKIFGLQALMPAMDFFEKHFRPRISGGHSYDEVRLLQLREQETVYCLLKEELDGIWIQKVIIVRGRDNTFTETIESGFNKKSEIGTTCSSAIIQEFKLPVNRQYLDEK